MWTVVKHAYEHTNASTHTCFAMHKCMCYVSATEV